MELPAGTTLKVHPECIGIRGYIHYFLLDFLTAIACNAVLYISLLLLLLLLLFFDFKVCENYVRSEGKLKPVDKIC